MSGFGFWLTGLFCWLSLTVPVQAQQTGMEWVPFGQDKGLLSREIYGVHFDPGGYLYAFTEFGAQRYNGRRFQLLAGFPRSGSVVHAFTEDEKGKLWLFTSGGVLGWYESDSLRIPKNLQQLTTMTQGRNSLVYSMKSVPGSGLQVNAFYNTFIVKPNGQLDTVPAIDSRKISIFPQNGNWWQVRKMATPGILPASEIEITGFQKNPVRIPLPKNSLKANRLFIHENALGLWVLLGETLFFLNREGNVQLLPLPDEGIFLKEIEGRIFLALYNKGLFEVNCREKTLHCLVGGVSPTSMARDLQGRFWISTLEKGLMYQREPWLRWIPEMKGEISMLKAEKNRLWIARTGFPDLQWISRTGTGTTLLPKPGPRLIYDVVEDQGGLYVGTNLGTFAFRHVSGEGQEMVRDAFSGKVASLVQMITTPDSTQFAIGRRVLILLQEKKSRLLQTYYFHIRGISVWKNKLWLGTDNGLMAYQWDGKSQVMTGMGNWFEGESIRTMGVVENSLWFFIPGRGLFIWRPTDREPTHMKGFPPSCLVFDMEQIGTGKWVAGSLQGCLQLAIGKAGSIRIEQVWYDFPVRFLEKWNHQIWLGTSNGLAVITLPHPGPQPVATQWIQSLSVNTRKISWKSGLEIDPNPKSVHFSFDVLQPGNRPLFLHFNLQGPRNLIGKSSDFELEFADLPPGRYVLETQLRDEFRILSGKPMRYSFEVKPAFWQTPTFQLLLALLLLILVGLVVWASVRFFRRKDAEANRIRQLLASYKITALQSQMNPHFISNSLTAIQNLILKKEFQLASEYLTKFSRLLRKVLDYSERPFVHLDEELSVIRINVELEQLRFARKIRFGSEVRPGLRKAACYLPSLITQPFVENAIWHGLLPISGIREPVLSLVFSHENESCFCCEIEDNGIGRGPSGKIPEHRSFGLKLTGERLENLNQLIKDNLASLTIQDLRDENGQPSGTRVKIVLPYNLHEKTH